MKFPSRTYSTCFENSNTGATDLFGMEMIYNQASININGTATTKQYSGNISAIRWKTDNKHDTPQEGSMAILMATSTNCPKQIMEPEMGAPGPVRPDILMSTA